MGERRVTSCGIPTCGNSAHWIAEAPSVGFLQAVQPISKCCREAPIPPQMSDEEMQALADFTRMMWIDHKYEALRKLIDRVDAYLTLKGQA
jgi:hypothetical protein